MSISRLTLILAGLIILLAIIGIWAGEPIEGLWRWPAAFLIALVAWERFRLATEITLLREIPATLALGEVISYSIIVSNQAQTSVCFETQADYPAGIEGDSSLQRWQLTHHETQRRHFSITPTQLGSTALGSVYLKQLGLFGLCWWTRQINDQISIKVEPVRLENTTQISGLQQQTGNRRSFIQHSGGVEFLDLSDYRQGDSLRSIDWKATARRGKPMVRRFEREHRLEIVVLIDCGRGSRIQCERLDRLHHYVNVAAKLTEFAASQGDRIACMAYAHQTVDKTPMTGGISSVKTIRQLLGQLSAINETANALNAALDVKQLLKRRGLVIFLTELEQPEAALQLIQAGKLLSAKHQVLIATLEDPMIANRLKQPSLHWQDPYRQFATLEYLRGRELTRRQLQSIGVAITSATAQLLDQQVLSYYQNKRDTIGAA